MTQTNGSNGRDELAERVAQLELAVARLRAQVEATTAQATLAYSDAQAARTLAAGADRDVSEVRAELRAHTQALNALRQTQLELAQAQREQGQELSEQGRALVAVRAEMTEGFAMVNAGISQIGILLQNVIDRG